MADPTSELNVLVGRVSDCVQTTRCYCVPLPSFRVVLIRFDFDDEDHWILFVDVAGAQHTFRPSPTVIVAQP